MYCVHLSYPHTAAIYKKPIKINWLSSLGPKMNTTIIIMMWLFHEFLTCTSLKSVSDTTKNWVPFIRHILQLHSEKNYIMSVWLSAGCINMDKHRQAYLQSHTLISFGAHTSNLTSPQWQPPVCFTFSILLGQCDDDPLPYPLSAVTI